MLRRASWLLLAAVLVASCASASSEPSRAVPSDAAEGSATSEASLTASLTPSLAPRPVSTSTSTPTPVVVPSPSKTPRLGVVVSSFKLVGPGTGWVETDNGLLVTRDDGFSWSDVSPSGDPHVVALDAVDAQTAFVASDTDDATTTTISIWHTSDGGRSWERATVGSFPSLGPSDCGCESFNVTIDAVDPRVVFADIVIHRGSDGETHDVHRSLDSGSTWTTIPFSIERTSSPGDLGIHFLTAGLGTVLWDDRTFTTRTGWGHWTEYPGASLGSVTYLDDRHWIMGSWVTPTKARVAESKDSGRTWTTLIRTIPETPNASLTFLDTTTWLATIETTSGPPDNKAGPAQTWTSTNAGKTWTSDGELPTSDILGSVFGDRSHGWVRTDAGGLASTSDGGITWSVILR